MEERRQARFDPKPQPACNQLLECAVRHLRFPTLRQDPLTYELLAFAHGADGFQHSDPASILAT